MVKRIKGFLAAAMVCCLLAGCGRGADAPLRVVSRIDVTCDRGYQILRRQYTEPEKITMVLNYLRLQKDLGKPNVDPEMILGDRMRIDVILSDGTHRFYYQQSGQFLSEKKDDWHKIDPKLASGFELRLQMIPTDGKPPARGQGAYF